MVVARDFNDWRQRASPILYRAARLGLKEVLTEAHGRPAGARTFPARFPLLRLNRINVRNVRISQPTLLAKRSWSHLSDHAPLAVEIHLVEFRASLMPPVLVQGETQQVRNLAPVCRRW